MQVNVTPKSARKVLPKPKPPNMVKKPRRQSNNSLQSNSSENMAAVASSQYADGTAHEQQTAPTAGAVATNAARSGSKVLPKPRTTREWSNTNARSNARKPILNKRVSRPLEDVDSDHSGRLILSDAMQG